MRRRASRATSEGVVVGAAFRRPDKDQNKDHSDGHVRRPYVIGSGVGHLEGGGRGRTAPPGGAQRGGLQRRRAGFPDAGTRERRGQGGHRRQLHALHGGGG